MKRQAPIESIRDTGDPQVPQVRFSFTLCLRTQECLSRPITFRFVEEFFLVLQFVCAARRRSVRTAFNHTCREQMPKQKSRQSSDNTSCGNTYHQVSRVRRDVLRFFQFTLILIISHAQSHLMISPIHWLMVSTLFVSHSTKSKIPKQNTGTHHFCRHVCTCFQRYDNVTDCDPFVSIHTFDHNTGTTSSVLLLPSKKPRTAFQFSALFPFSTVIFIWLSAPRFARWSVS